MDYRNNFVYLLSYCLRNYPGTFGNHLHSQRILSRPGIDFKERQSESHQCPEKAAIWVLSWPAEHSFA